MARMIPPQCPPDAAPGEKKLFSALAEAHDTDDWVVLHSLWLAEHVRQVEGEADFVILVPNVGILVIEVKSHQRLEILSDGRWKLGNNLPTSRDPFQQAREALHSIRRYLEKTVDLRSIPFVSCAWFSEVRARIMMPESPEWHDWQVLDSEDLKGDVRAVVQRTLAAGVEHFDDKIKYFSYGGVGPNAQEVERIIGRLRPRAELHMVPGDLRRAREFQLVTLVEEQVLALDSASENRSMLFSGPAGSGKTFLAMESARRELGTGKQGRLLCFNRLLGKRLSVDMADVAGLIVGTFHQELFRLAGLTRAPDNPAPEFWSEELPERAAEALIDGDVAPADFLVVDEIQDIATDSYLDVLDLMVEGGLKDGRVLFFGDFERQAILENEKGRERLWSRTPHLSTYKLMQNCRNLPRIGYQVNLLSHLQPGYQKFRRQDDGIDPVFRQYQAGQDQSALLVAAIRGLRDEGYELNEIVVLSPVKDGSTASTTGDPWLRQVLRPADGLAARPGRVLYSTIHAFKGLESPAVVVTDLDETTTTDNFDSLLYVGLTRATDRLIAIIEVGTLRHAIGGPA